MAPDGFDFQQIVGTAAGRIEQEGVPVDQSAREVLIERARVHADDIRREVGRQGLTEVDLVNAAERQLREALPFLGAAPRQQEQQQQQQQQQQNSSSNSSSRG